MAPHDAKSALYDADYARRYRSRDEQLAAVDSYHALVKWVGGVCDRFSHPIDVLDLGCGTGRYFWGLRRVNTLTCMTYTRFHCPGSTPTTWRAVRSRTFRPRFGGA